jgi:signal transduction histidine kinase
MDITINCKLSAALAERVREEREDLTRRWLERIVDRLDVEPQSVFPTDELLDHVPMLMDRIADYMEDPADEITADGPLIGKALEMGELRYAQGFGAQQLLKEYEILGGVLFAFLVRSVDALPGECTRGELLACAHRLFRAVSVIQQLTTARFLALAAERVREREERLRSFNRMVSHELKNRIGAVLGAAQLLAEPGIADDPAQRARFASMVESNAEGMREVLQNLLELTRMDDARRQRSVLLPTVTAEVCRQLREMAQASGVTVQVEPLPEVEVNAPAMELCLGNYVSNAIKYADPARDERWVRIHARLENDREEDEGPCRVVVAVEDNGLGIPEAKRPRLFTRFYRAHNTITGVEGTGLGLSIVREMAEGMGGRAWAEFDVAEGSRFLVSIPCRRDSDRERALGEASEG